MRDAVLRQRIQQRTRYVILAGHVGDPDTWYSGKYDPAKFGTRDEHYAMWESALSQFRDRPWIGAHLGGNPENLLRLQDLLDRYPNLYLDMSATRWMVREVSALGLRVHNHRVLAASASS